MEFAMDNAVHRLHNVVHARFDAIAAAEKITRQELGLLSREALTYVVESQDIEFVNRLLGVLTPVNRRASILYFQHFLPWEVEHDKEGNFNRFAKKMQGEKKIHKRLELIAAWLADEANNLWTWADDNIEMKQKDFKSAVARAIKQALKGDEKTNTDPLSVMDLMSAIFEGGVTIDMMMEGIVSKEEQIKAEQAKIAA